MPAESDNPMNASEKYAALFPIVQEIALQLTAITKREWVAQSQNPVEFWNYIKVTSGHSELSIGTFDTRITIDGNTPRNPTTYQYIRVYVPSATGGWDEFKFHGITVAFTKSAEAIAKDIQRRFLPDYEKAVALTLARIEADAKYATDKRANLEACARTLDVTLRSDYRDIRGCDAVYEPLGSFSSKIGDTIRVEVKASSTDVDVDIDNLTVEQAKAVLQFIKTAF